MQNINGMKIEASESELKEGQAMTTRILGVDFFCGSLTAAVERALAGGLVVAPSGPGMSVDLVRSLPYRSAVQSADLALADSGWMIILWRIFCGERLPRISGLAFMRAILERPEIQDRGSAFWVMPSIEDDVRNRAWLSGFGLAVSEEDTYIAPKYGVGDIHDEILARLVIARRPRVIMIAIGGGVQERLGLSLRRQLCYRPTILCLGAAIAFLTGGQANIPPWADRLYLGWLLRILSAPRQYMPRYWSAIRLASLLRRFQDRLPPLEIRQ